MRPNPSPYLIGIAFLKHLQQLPSSLCAARASLAHVTLGCRYCVDIVQKRLYDDVAPLLQCMRQGFAAVYGASECEALKLMKVEDLQHKLFPLDPVTVQAFRNNSSFRDGANAKLMWKVMQEELSQQQVQNVFYFATNWHTVSAAPRKVDISFEQREHKVCARACVRALARVLCIRVCVWSRLHACMHL